MMNVTALILWVRGELWSVVGDTLLFALIGIVMFGLAFWLIVKLSPFSVRKELEQDHNVALAVVIAAVIIGLAIIIASAIHGV
jgi:putative membrane protein